MEKESYSQVEIVELDWRAGCRRGCVMSHYENTEIVALLPAPLAERTRLIGSQGGPFVQGNYVLYWMRTAMRAHENPALNVAIEIANEFSLPLLVYQGLSERYPFASDRHHTFVLQGARDVQRELSDRGINYVLHVERRGHRGPHLKTLASAASVVVTEDMPTLPLARWTSQLSNQIAGPLLAVDTACIVPMRLVGRSFERAFAFRNATKRFYLERVSTGPFEIELQTTDLTIDLPFEPVDLLDKEISVLVSDCDVDHSIGPVTHTRGGYVAGYARWELFKRKGLATYDRRRNNALIDGVSRMSSYLHFGMVAPTRIAREANEIKTKGAEKFLDELLIWRELAYAFCCYRSDHGRTTAIPAWARDTLRDHENDARTLLSWETMSRASTGDSIWDSAQRSLLIHGELHNNVRMTWGKAILSWTKDAKQALGRIIDLNHRYALDGRDPASYGGILWCLGQFDRPFNPPQSVFGTVRTRSTQQHAQRLNPVAYREKVTRSLWKSTPRVAVIGAGISGLIAARILADHGSDVKVYEKSRGFGGRMSTRRSDSKIAFDHGAQYFTARDELFKRYVRSWLDDGLVKRWEGRIVGIEKGEVKSEKSNVSRYVAVPGMSSLGQHLATDINVSLETTVSTPLRDGDQWMLQDERRNELGHFDAVIVAVPSHQATPLLKSAQKLAEQSAVVKMDACWALMVAFNKSLDLEFDAAFVDNSPVSWISRNCSKPDRPTDSEAWVVHASPAWSEANIESVKKQVREMLMSEFFKSVGIAVSDPIYCSAHRWRFAIPKNALANTFLFDEEQMIGACGDWCGGPRVEGAFLSGVAIAGRLLGHFSTSLGLPIDDKQQLELF